MRTRTPWSRRSSLRKPAVHPSDAARLDAIKRARPPQSDPTGQCHDRLGELAKRLQLDIVDVLDFWAERAAIREWDGGFTRRESETLAVDDTRAHFDPQQGFG